MQYTTSHAEVSNPFSSRCVVPEAVPFFFPDEFTAKDVQIDLMVKAFVAHRSSGQIVGPHGTGKTTLVAEIVRQLIAHGAEVWSITLRDRQCHLTSADNKRLATLRNARSQATPCSEKIVSPVVVIDGFEQLEFMERLRVRWVFRSGGVLMTSHQRLWHFPKPLPILWETRPDLATTQRVVAHLLRDRTWSLAPDEVATLHHRHGGNVRLVLDELYDHYEGETPSRIA